MARILLIDRERLTRELLQQFLSRWGHEVIAVENAALPVGAGPEPEVVVLNAGGSWEAAAAGCRELRAQQPPGRTPPIVVMLDWVTAAIERELRQAGADEVFPRLMKLEELLAALDRMTRSGDGG